MIKFFLKSDFFMIEMSIPGVAACAATPVPTIALMPSSIVPNTATIRCHGFALRALRGISLMPPARRACLTDIRFPFTPLYAYMSVPEILRYANASRYMRVEAREKVTRSAHLSPETRERKE